jgi:ABC-type transport system involved in multi-copper enzyme maturation permease subunit
MSAQVRSELLKLRTTRTGVVLLLAALGITAFGALVEGISPALAKLGTESAQRAAFGANITAVLLATIAGIVTVTSEFRYGTIEPTLLFEPRRRVVVSAKRAVAAATGVVFALACTALSFGVGATLLTVRGAGFAISAGHVWQLILGTVLASALGGMIGVALGVLIRNQLNVIVALLAYVVAVDAGVFRAAPAVGRFLPGKSGDAIAGQAVDGLLPPATAAVVLAFWTLGFAGAALVRVERADVERA